MVRKSRKSREEWKTYKNVFDSFAERNLFELASQGHFDAIESPIALGKEANVFTARKKDGSVVIIKIYRLENCNFKKMFQYISADPRFSGIQNQRRKIIFSWVQREYRNLLLAREKIRVPTPFAFKDNIILMECIGGEEPAPKLKDKKPADPKIFMKKTIDNMKSLLKAGLIHGDLSDFNILNDKEDPVFIDFSQGTTVKAPAAEQLLERDVHNVMTYFRRFIKLTDEEEAKVVADLNKALEKAIDET